MVQKKAKISLKSPPSVVPDYTRRYEPVEQGSCADPGIFVRRGGGGGGPENSLDNDFF